MLSVRDAHVAYGTGVVALQGVSLEVRAGEAVALVGANGAGKTTLLKTISGSCRRGAARSGSTAAASTTSRRRTAWAWASRSCPRADGSSAASPSPRTCGSAPSSIATRSAASRCSIASSASSPCCAQRVDQRAGTLSGGEGQMLSIARALMSRPRFLMLDEPSLGIMPRIVDSILDVLQMLHREEGLTVLLVEQNVPAALAAAERGYVLQTGRIVAEGTSQSLLDSDLVRQAYLGM